MGARFDRLRCEVFQNLFLSPMNTGFVRPAVATVPTVYGIETHEQLYLNQNPLISYSCNSTYRLRYATKGARQQRSKATMRPAHL